MHVCRSCHKMSIGKRPAINVSKWREWAVSSGDVMRAAVDTADALGHDAVVAFHGTGLSVREHQERTVDNFVELRRIATDLPIVPVLQGWTKNDYLACADLYRRRGIDLKSYGTVCIGSVCRRQGTREATEIMSALRALGMRLHAFGFKILGLLACACALASADSMAWSYEARRRPPRPECVGLHINCANCAHAALDWFNRLAALLSALDVRDEVSPTPDVSSQIWLPGFP